MAGSWSRKDEKFLSDNFYTTDIKVIASKLKRSVSAVRNKGHQLGLYKSKKKITSIYPESSQQIKDVLGEYIDDLDSSRKTLKKWVERLDGSGRVRAGDLVALSKSMDSLNKSIETLAKIYGILEKKETHIENVNINMNIYQLIQAANEVMQPDQRIRFIKNLKSKGVIDEVLIP